MTIKEVEGLTGLSRSIIRFYEKEELIEPKRNGDNGYRDYSEKDLVDIKKIAYLRTLGLSVEQIRKAIRHEVDLTKLLQKQKHMLVKQQSDLHDAQLMCEKILESNRQVNYDNLHVEEYAENLNEYWEKNRNILKLDTVGFFYIWGGFVFWTIITVLSILIAVLSVRFLPDKIPVQWSDGKPNSFVNNLFIFAFPVACVFIKYVLRPFIWRWFQQHFVSTDAVIDYTINSLCFLALAIEVFIIYSASRATAHVEVIIIAIGMVLLGVPIMMRLAKVKHSHLNESA